VSKESIKKQSQTWIVAQITLGVFITLFVVCWLSGYISTQNYYWFIALLVVIVIGSLILSFKVKLPLKILWVMVGMSSIVMLVVMYALKDFTIQF